jgi:hypothetical protein
MLTDAMELLKEKIQSPLPMLPIGSGHVEEKWQPAVATPFCSDNWYVAPRGPRKLMFHDENARVSSSNVN